MKIRKIISYGNSYCKLHKKNYRIYHNKLQRYEEEFHCDNKSILYEDENEEIIEKENGVNKKRYKFHEDDNFSYEKDGSD